MRLGLGLGVNSITSQKVGGVQNLLLASEAMNATNDWGQFLISVSANSTDEAAPNATDTAEKLTFTDDRQSRIQQQVALKANTTYTFSVYAKVRTGTKAFRLRNSTLGQAQQFTADTSWGLNPEDGRYSFSFITGATATTHTLSIQNASTAGTGEVFFWGAMLNEGATAGGYVKTDPSVGGSAPTPAYSGFGDAFGGVTAYYSLRQFTEAETLNAIRVRRSSDDTEQDIGFDANGDLDTTALLAFVNEDVNKYTSDFSSTEDLDDRNGTGAAAQSVGGVDDAYKFTLTSNVEQVYEVRIPNPITTGCDAVVNLDFYVPSSNSVIDGIDVRDFGGGNSLQNNTTDAWTSVQLNVSDTTNGNIRVIAIDGTDITPLNGNGDVFYLKNIVVTQTTADGAVTTFYDQSGNGNNATNSTASEQPLIVDGGSIIYSGATISRPAIEFDGEDDYLQNTSLVSNTPTTHYLTAKANSTGTTQRFTDGGVSSSTRHSIYQNAARFQYFGGVNFTGDLEDTNQNLHYFLANGTSSEIGVNGATASVGNAGTNTLNGLTFASRWDGGAQWGDVLIQELIIFDSDQSSNRGTITTGGGTGIEGNINTYFNIV